MRSVEELKVAREGWINFLKGDSAPDNIKQMATERMDICLSCPLLVYSVSMKRFENLANGIKILLGKPVEEATGHSCGICGCQFKAMALAPSKECPYYEKLDGSFEPLGWPNGVEQAVSAGTVIKKPKWHKRP